VTQASVPKGQQRLLFLLQPNASAGAGGPASFSLRNSSEFDRGCRPVAFATRKRVMGELLLLQSNYRTGVE